MINKKKLFGIAGGVIFLAAAKTVYLVAPGKAKDNMRAPFLGRNFAHRGLHSADKSIPENSLPAFEEAAKYGYGVELDVHITKDGRIVVFHDDTLSRICGVEGRVEDMTWDELCKLRLLDTEYGIPLFSEVLTLISKRCPMIVELKRGKRNRELCEKTYELLKEFGGTYCVESFDPRIVFWFRMHAPEVLRGQLSRNPSDMVKNTGKLSSFMVGNLFTNALARPHFIAYGIGKRPLTVRLCRLLGAMKVAWTSHDPKNEAKNDAVIFEYYRPAVKYK